MITAYFLNFRLLGYITGCFIHFIPVKIKKGGQYWPPLCLGGCYFRANITASNAAPAKIPTAPNIVRRSSLLNVTVTSCLIVTPDVKTSKTLGLFWLKWIDACVGVYLFEIFICFLLLSCCIYVNKLLRVVRWSVFYAERPLQNGGLFCCVGINYANFYVWRTRVSYPGL